MAQFTFKLESVRALREQAERAAQEELARELALSAAREQALNDAGTVLGDAQRALAAVPGSTLTPQELIARQAYLERRERLQSVAAAELALQLRNVESRRARLARAARDREALERAKERAREEHVREQARVEEEALGEIALALHRRRLAA
jgi:flagellar FliJ protein